MSRKTISRSSSPPSTAAPKPTAKARPKAAVPLTHAAKAATAAKTQSKVSAASRPAAPSPAPDRANGSHNGSHAAVTTIRPPSNGSPLAAKAPEPPLNGQQAASQLLNRAERDIATAIDSLNTQMNTALTALAELASAHAERGRAVVRTAPLDRATATFQRLVAEVVDDQLGEMLPPLIALRNEMAQWAAGGDNGSPEADFHRRGMETLDHVLALAGAASFDARPGQAFDPLIHLAVGETAREDLPAGAVAECIQAGFRSSRGKVLAPARIRINRPAIGSQARS
jgi:hypothetical protein